MKASKKQHQYLEKTAIFLVGLLGMVIFAPPGYRIAKRHFLQLQAHRLWNLHLAENEVKSGGPFAWLESESGSVNSLIVWDATEANLQNFPAWYAHSAKPDQTGMGVVFGHRDSHFRNLAELQFGEKVQIATADRQWPFRVAQIDIIPKEQLAEHLARSAGRQGVLLVTCYPFRYAGPAPQRYLVWLEPRLESPSWTSEHEEPQA